MIHNRLFSSPRRLGYLIDIEYVGRRGIAGLKFLDPYTQTIFKWYDQTGHKSYLLTDAPSDAITQLVGEDVEYLGNSSVSRYNAILDEEVQLRKVFAETPLAIGGEAERVRSTNYRSALEGAGYSVWEAWVRYINSYCYDLNLEMGMPYWVYDNKIVPFTDFYTEEEIEEEFRKLEEEGVVRTPALEHWLKIFEYDLPEIKMCSVDIEVLPESLDSLSNPILADQPVMAISIVGTDGRKDILVWKRVGVEIGEGEVDGKVTFFYRESDMIREALRIIMKYPFVITFNGDNFDLMYLYNRGKKVGIPTWFNPIYVVKKTCRLTTGIHIDLYPFLKNPSIQNYAYQGKYKSFDLDTISKALLGKEKLEFKNFLDHTLLELARYCLNDAVLTLELMTNNNNTMLNLILSLTRMANISIYQLTRNRIGDWVKSTFFYLLRKWNYLIPNTKELKSKGEIQTKASIKGKKYQGAIVHEPVPGVKFLVIVMDFQSLYPTEVKERNVGYGTINCVHEECQDNGVPDTTHWICKKRRAIEADVIGGLRDIRVFIYKPLSKVKDNPEKAFHTVLEQAIKVYINASYGVFGNEGFGLYCPPVAEAITAFSRRDMQAVINKAIAMGIEVLGGDTDSVFLWKPTKEQTAELQRWATEELNLDLGIDKVYRYALFSRRKKNYLGIFQDGRADIKGLTGKKRHTPDVIKTPFFEVVKMLEQVNNEEEYERTRIEIQKRILDIQRKIVKRKWDNLDDLAYHMRMGRDIDDYKVNSQHVKAARILAEHGYDVRAGDDIHFIKTTTEEGVEPLQYANEENVDLDSYLEALSSTFEQITDCMDIDIEVIRVGGTELKKETRLSEFMQPAT